MGKYLTPDGEYNWNENNHNELGNPHPQYDRFAKYTYHVAENQYVKLFEFISDPYASASTRFREGTMGADKIIFTGELFSIGDTQTGGRFVTSSKLSISIRSVVYGDTTTTPVVNMSNALISGDEGCKPKVKYFIEKTSNPGVYIIKFYAFAQFFNTTLSINPTFFFVPENYDIKFNPIYSAETNTRQKLDYLFYYASNEVSLCSIENYGNLLLNENVIDNKDYGEIVYTTSSTATRGQVIFATVKYDSGTSGPKTVYVDQPISNITKTVYINVTDLSLDYNKAVLYKLDTVKTGNSAAYEGQRINLIITYNAGSGDVDYYGEDYQSRSLWIKQYSRENFYQNRYSSSNKYGDLIFRGDCYLEDGTSDSTTNYSEVKLGDIVVLTRIGGCWVVTTHNKQYRTQYEYSFEDITTLSTTNRLMIPSRVLNVNLIPRQKTLSDLGLTANQQYYLQATGGIIKYIYPGVSINNIPIGTRISFKNNLEVSNVNEKNSNHHCIYFIDFRYNVSFTNESGGITSEISNSTQEAQKSSIRLKDAKATYKLLPMDCIIFELTADRIWTQV